jgi:hypothetical protein
MKDEVIECGADCGNGGAGQWGMTLSGRQRGCTMINSFGGSAGLMCTLAASSGGGVRRGAVWIAFGRTKFWAHFSVAEGQRI